MLAAERDVMADELAHTREIGAVPRQSGPPMRQTVGPALGAPAAAGLAGNPCEVGAIFPMAFGSPFFSARRNAFNARLPQGGDANAVSKSGSASDETRSFRTPHGTLH